VDFGRYWIVDPKHNWLVAGDEIGLCLLEVATWCDKHGAGRDLWNEMQTRIKSLT
jgi:hypothetical protein